MTDSNDILKAQRAFDRHDAWDTKANDLLVQSGVLFVRSTLILNGAAVIALLAFLSSTLASPDLSDDHRYLVNGILKTLPLFGAGAFLAVVTSGLGYLVNYLYLWAHRKHSFHWDHPYVRPSRGFKAITLFGNVLAAITIAVGIVSLVAFLVALLDISNLAFGA